MEKQKIAQVEWQLFNGCVHVTLYAFRFTMSSARDFAMPATHPGATLRLSTLEVWEAIGQVRETQVQQANLLTALTHIAL